MFGVVSVGHNSRVRDEKGSITSSAQHKHQ